jgi:diaminobutyrate-2-oxoglutarate transaminase
LNAASKSWLQSIAKLAKRHGALLIIDDIQAGCGRTGSFFSFENMGIEPDIVTLSKSLSGYGLPMAVALIKPEYDQWLPGEHNGTFRGNNHAFVTATVALEKFWSDHSLMGQVQRNSSFVRHKLSELSDHFSAAKVKGRGMIQGLDIGSGELTGAICRRAFEKGLIIETSGAFDQVLKVLTPLNTPVELLERGFEILEQAVVKTLDGQRLTAI